MQLKFGTKEAQMACVYYPAFFFFSRREIYSPCIHRSKGKFIVRFLDTTSTNSDFDTNSPLQRPLSCCNTKGLFRITDFPPFLQQLITSHNCLRYCLVAFCNLIDKACYKRLDKIVKREIQKACNAHWNHLLESLSFEDNSLWKIAKSITKQPQFNQPLLIENQLNFDSATKAEFAANYLSSSMNNIITNPSTDSTAEDMYNTIYQTLITENLPTTTDAEVLEILQSLNIHKAPGPDLNTNKMLKHFSKSKPFTKFLVNHFNSCLQNCYFPLTWKTGHVVIIPKPSKDPIIGNYRPITLLSSTSKVHQVSVHSALAMSAYILMYEMLPSSSEPFQNYGSHKSAYLGSEKAFAIPPNRPKLIFGSSSRLLNGVTSSLSSTALPPMKERFVFKIVSHNAPSAQQPELNRGIIRSSVNGKYFWDEEKLEIFVEQKAKVYFGIKPGNLVTANGAPPVSNGAPPVSNGAPPVSNGAAHGLSNGTSLKSSSSDSCAVNGVSKTSRNWGSGRLFPFSMTECNKVSKSGPAMEGVVVGRRTVDHLVPYPVSGDSSDEEEERRRRRMASDVCQMPHREGTVILPGSCSKEQSAAASALFHPGSPVLVLEHHPAPLTSPIAPYCAIS
ncbi:hypothetical protein J437_LFUL002503 [Ladona fulva]|uniref:RNA-directed DNA polymerase from mobile element jockey n=1 Tax=Ladona fulva TaxID=123851 RepID=A0A8K0KSE2_LADFU|nr:hypothetical protein J437_LFUL002503 [Ladona fulva]